MDTIYSAVSIASKNKYCLVTMTTIILVKTTKVSNIKILASKYKYVTYTEKKRKYQRVRNIK